MPYIKSIRSYHEKSEENILKRFDITGGDRIWTAGGFRHHEFINAGEHQFIIRDRYSGEQRDVRGLLVANNTIDATAYMWGGGGGGATPQSWGFGAPGGGGGYATGDRTFVSNGTWRVVVGGAGGGSGQQNSPAGGGGNGTSWGNGSGGGMSGIFDNDSYTQGTASLIAGGGGGGGSSRAGTGNNGGGGGGTSGQNGFAPYQGQAGRAGTQNAGGAGADGQGQAGSALQGGAGGPHGGGGGGGYYGGGAGSYVEPNGMNGGGGGSGYFNSGHGWTNTTLTAGSAQTVANSASPYWSANAGTGGNVSGQGNVGRLIIRYPYNP